MPGGGTRETIVATGNPVSDLANYQAVLASFPIDGGTLLIDGMLALDAFVHVDKPVHHVGVDPESGFSLAADGAVYWGNAGSLVDPSDTAWGGANEGDYYLNLPTALVATLQPLDWLYLYSEDVLPGVVPHQGDKQFPGENHQVMEIGATSGATTRVYLRDSLRDAMTVNPKVSLRTLSRAFRQLVIENLVIARRAPRSLGLSIAVNDVWNAKLRNLRMVDGPGAIAMNSPDCEIQDLFIGSQADELNVYGVIAGAQANSFRVRAHLHDTRHAFTTSGVPVTTASGTHISGTPWGVVTLTGSGRHTVVLDTHASGKGIVFDGCDVSVVGHSTAEVGYGFHFRARNTILRNSRIHGSHQGGMFGGIVHASDCRIVNSEFSHLWIGIDVQTNSEGLLVKDNLFDRCLTAAVWVSSGSDTQIISNHVRHSSKLAVGSPALSRALITIASGTNHRLIGNDLRKADNPDAIFSLDIKGLPAAAVELRDNDFAGFATNLGMTGTNSAALHSQSATWNYPRLPAGLPAIEAGENITITGDGTPQSPFVISGEGSSGPSLLDIYDEGVLIGGVSGIDLIGTRVSATLDGAIARIVVLADQAHGGSCGSGPSDYVGCGDLLRHGQVWLAAQLTRHCATEVTYQRGGLQVVVRATIGHTTLESDDGQGVGVESFVRDFLIDTRDLLLAGAQTLPREGDRIRERVGGEVHVHEVLPIGNEPAWRYADPHREKLRIHTKLIATEPA